MIELIPTEHDDVAFLALAQRIMNGAVVELQMREIFCVHVDNWFDHKWLGWRSRREELRVPLFTPNRVRSERHFAWDEDKSAWANIGFSRSLHVRQPGRPWLAQPLDRYSKSAAFVWYSGNTAINSAGSLMLYLSGAEGYSWYASLRNRDGWIVEDGFRVTKGELSGFEQRGRQLEMART